MARLGQIGIVIGALGAMLTLMGLFPGVTGLSPTVGIGIIQIFVILTGFTLLILGALIYVKYTFYAHSKSTLVQQIGTRLAMTGLVLAAISGLADALGFGSHNLSTTGDYFLGPWQASGVLGNFLLSCIGVLIYAIAGDPESPRNNNEDTPEADQPEDEP